MADIERFIPFLILFEAGVDNKRSLTAEELFRKARASGFSCDPDDRGGATMIGVTLATFSDYRRLRRMAVPDVAALRNISYAEWLDILKTMFWDRWLADSIRSQPVAEMLVDWVWTSGAYGIREPQRLLGVKADGIVGPKTIAAVNSSDPAALFDMLKGARISYTERICRSRPANRKFRRGWLRRIEAHGYYG